MSLLLALQVPPLTLRAQVLVDFQGKLIFPPTRRSATTTILGGPISAHPFGEVPISGRIEQVVTQDEGWIPVEWLQGVSQSRSAPIESVGSIAPGFSIPTDWQGTVARQAIISADWVGTLSSPGVIPIEVLGNLVKSGVIPFEVLAQLLQKGSIPFEVLAQLVQKSSVPLETLGQLLQKGSIPVEWQSVVTLAAQFNIPVEWISAAGPLVFFNWLAGGGGAPVWWREWPTPSYVRLVPQTPLEHLRDHPQVRRRRKKVGLPLQQAVISMQEEAFSSLKALARLQLKRLRALERETKWRLDQDDDDLLLLL